MTAISGTIPRECYSNNQKTDILDPENNVEKDGSTIWTPQKKGNHLLMKEENGLYKRIFLLQSIF
jgi:hypothetical protein